MTLENSLKKKWNKILILGNGYVGSNLYNHLKDSWDVSIIDSKTLNYHDPSILTTYLLNNGIEIVVYCSGFTGRPNVDEGEVKKKECWTLNVTSPITINTICNNFKIKYIHISSGCIYGGYDKEFTEEDEPNFGLFDYSSFYSKSKHAFELMSNNLNNKIVRIRMPITPDLNPRNYITKIKNYNNIVDYLNSKTYIPDLCIFIEKLLENEDSSFWNGQDIYNVVNPNPLSTKQITDLMSECGVGNPEWKYVDIEDLNITAPRSNCVLNGKKANTIYQMRDEIDIVEEALSKIQA